MRIAFLLLLLSCIGWASDHFEKGKEWAEKLEKHALDRNLIKDYFSKLNPMIKITEENSLEKSKKCHFGHSIEEANSNVFVFISFSLPEETLLSLSKELEKVGGSFVINGLPNNSFRELAKQLYSLTLKGLNVPVMLNPKMFSKYHIQAVPSFIVVDGLRFDKINGNISLKFALEKLASEGETSKAKSILEKL